MCKRCSAVPHPKPSKLVMRVRFIDASGTYQEDGEETSTRAQDDGTTLAGLRWLYTASHAGNDREHMQCRGEEGGRVRGRRYPGVAGPRRC